MKKIALLILSLSLLLVGVLALASCGECEHDWVVDEANSVAATCAAEGKTAYKFASPFKGRQLTVKNYEFIVAPQG